MIDQFVAAVVKKIRADMNTKTDQLASGFSKNIEEYRHTCGEIRGLAMAEEYILALAKENEEAE